MRLPFIRRTQEADMTGLIDHAEVFDRMDLLLAAVVGLLVLGIGGSVNRSLPYHHAKKLGTPVKELPLHCLNRVLFQIGQNE
jgi:hypothetical protein